MKTRNKKRILGTRTILIACGLLVCLSGCSSKEKEPPPFQIVFTSFYINESAVSEYGASLVNDIPELSIDGKAPLFTPMIMGEARNNLESGTVGDPMMAMAGIMRLTTLVASGEIDIIISDLDNAARNARGGLFLPLSDVCTADDLAALNDRLLSFDLLSNDGYEPTPTGEKTPICGINITGNERIRRIFGDQEIGVFIVANTKNLELAKRVIVSLF
jgi:hypothetical protein